MSETDFLGTVIKNSSFNLVMEEIVEGDRVRCKIYFGAQCKEQNATVIQIDGFRCQVKLNSGNFRSLKRIDIIKKLNKNEIVTEILKDL